MTDVAVEEKTEETAPAEQPAAQKEPAPKAQPHACLCGFYEVVGATEDEVFSTGCAQTTMRMFAQGHDARLVSFLVDGFFDGYKLQMVEGGVTKTYNTPAEAAARASDSLSAKALKATASRQLKVSGADERKAARDALKERKATEKAIKDAAKAAEKAAAAEAKKTETKAPQKAGAEVIAGSAEGDSTPLAEDQVKIKVGRWEYNAEIDGDGVATFLDGKGDIQRIERDGYRILTGV